MLLFVLEQMDPPIYHIRMERKQRLDEFAIAKRHVAMNKLNEEFTALGGRHRGRSLARRSTGGGGDGGGDGRRGSRDDRGRGRDKARNYAPKAEDRRDDGRGGRQAKQRYPNKRT